MDFAVSELKIKTNDDKNEENKKKKYTSLKNRDYVPLVTIGSGYYGVVKLATSKIHKGNVAIKIITKFKAPNNYLTKFVPREIECVKVLGQHPNIINYYHSIETTHRLYIIMEYAEKGNLFDYIKTNTYVKEAQSRKWFNNLVDVINYCHSKDIAHRDIKCENILLDSNFNLKLSDFGFARRVDNLYGLANTFCGSYAYIAPEILKGRPYSPFVSDIWSMGVVLYAMVFGCLPFDDSNFFILMQEIRKQVRFPQKPQVTEECEKLITRILKPIKSRPSLEEIKQDIWFDMQEIVENTTTDSESSQLVGTKSVVGKSTKVPKNVSEHTIAEENLNQFSQDSISNPSKSGFN